MAKKKVKRKSGQRRSQKSKTGILSVVTDKPSGITAGQLGIAVGSYAVGSVASAVFGKWTGLPGLIIGGAGVVAKNLYLTSFGAGMFLGAGVKGAQEQGLVGVDEDDLMGIDLETVKGRAKEYFKMLGKKLFIPIDNDTATQATNGLNGEDVTYFVNPYTRKQDKINMSELDRISAQIAEMNRPMEGMGQYEEADRNF